MRLETPILRWSNRRRLPMVHQAEAAECGLACLAMVAAWHGCEMDLATLRQRFPISIKGSTLKDLIEFGAQLGLVARPLRCELSAVSRLRLPCILHWNFSHFVVLRQVGAHRIRVHDPAIGERNIALSELSDAFTGVAVEFAPGADFEQKRERQTLRMNQLWTWQPETRRAFLQAIALSLIIEVLSLTSPYYLQLVVDQAIAKGDLDLLGALAFAFGLVMLFNSIASSLRALTLQFLANVVSYDMGVRLFHHFLRLPLDYFQKRKLGDLLQRFRSLEPIKQFIVSGGIATIIDGVLAALTLILMALYSVPLTLLAVGAVLTYAGLRYFARTLARRYATDSMVADSREQTQFLETIRSMQTVKSVGGEVVRENEWLNLYVAKLNTAIRIGNLGIAYQAASGVLSGLSDIAIVYFAARRAIAGEITIGIITAFLAYKSQFMSRIVSLADQLVQYRMLDVQLARVAEIALAEEEVGIAARVVPGSELRGEFELKNVEFRYAPTEQPVLDRASLRIGAGEFVAIMGRSGEGKTTLIKVLLGLYSHQNGEVLVDGRPISEYGVTGLRRSLGIVTQDDQLLTGTIAQNVAQFDEVMDFDRIRSCCSSAEIDQEIMELPMQYHTLVGDLGTSLSAGQRQRVLIARALYRSPRALILDEATVHLGQECERRIVEMLGSLAITRIVATHSPLVARAAGRVVHLRSGGLYQVSTGAGDCNPHVTAGAN